MVDLAVVGAVDGPLVVCFDRDSAVWTWDVQRDLWRQHPLAYAFADDPLAAQYPDAANELDAVAAAVHGGRVLPAAGGHEQGAALWDLESGALVRVARYDEPYVQALTLAEGEEAPRFGAGADPGVLVWELPAEEPPQELPECDDNGVWAVATMRINSRSLVVGVAATWACGIWRGTGSWPRSSPTTARLRWSGWPGSPITSSWWRRIPAGSTRTQARLTGRTA
ncbi:hypothetical protein AVL59_20555 [Streptomyces griseochromogenes]|uniref:WD40 repeat domain-containing protein n=1 Tax=Streptomyces griseochromogenes TaxID=68214 RepID=A0A1B1AYP5_9ACTN|nr:hypothetical protein AVL59_20555 [Streptomyces griseochromogenes]